VIDDVAPVPGHGLGGPGIALQGHADGIDRQRHLPLGEDAHQPPEADPRAVLVGRLDAEVARAAARGGEEEIGQARLRRVVVVQDRALAALLVVEHEVHGEARATRPARVGRAIGVADEIAGIARRDHPRGPGGRGRA
jgi:hypothetical protein